MRISLIYLWLSTQLLPACASTPEIALNNKVFYEDGDRVHGQKVPPELRLQEWDAAPFIGVGALGAHVGFRRPMDWSIRKADGGSISYQSPRQAWITISVLEDDPEASWEEVLGRYEAVLKEQNIHVIGKRIPVGCGNAQGRKYILGRGKAGGAPVTVEEVIVRNPKALFLIQVSYNGNRRELDRELGTFFRSFLILS